MDLKEKKEYIDKIRELARKKNAVIFAHYYTRPEIQETADFIGDSLALAQQLIDEVKSVGGTLSLLWHNQSLCEDFGWKGWRNVYENVLDYADKARRSK